MSTVLFHGIVFGPVHSRRLGASLGINLLPCDGKLCSFDCIYCECGYNKDFRTKTKLPGRENVKAALEDKLVLLQKDGTSIDVITFAGNGEPTMHPLFAEIIDDTIGLRDRYFPAAGISVLSNAMHAGKQKVFDALSKVDHNILKLDSAILDTARLIDRPNSPEYSIEKQIELFKRFNGDFIMQTMFVKGSHDGKVVDNTTEEEISVWLQVVKETNPREVMIYTVDRETPEKDLEKVSVDRLKEIAKRVEALNIKTNVAG
ncbi:MAG: radical SAM protein [Prevotella sp.]|jgi:wyosine [tRNA(Phe)-imidazoG37] synthetase (radical SAM superfamily)|nr:radical SAM protein [Prevotella sp.]